VRNNGKLVAISVLVFVVLGIGVLGYARANSIAALTDPNDVTPAVATDASLNGLWYGPLSITRFDTSGHPYEHLSEAFYLKLDLHADRSISGTYTTCSYTNSVKRSALNSYTMETGVLSPNGKTINLYLFAPMYGTASGDSLALQGQRYMPHGDAVTDSYASTLHKVADSTYLSACHIIEG